MTRSSRRSSWRVWLPPASPSGCNDPGKETSDDDSKSRSILASEDRKASAFDAMRRKTLKSLLFGSGYIGLRALATGLPASLLLAPPQAQANDACGATASVPQYLILRPRPRAIP